MTQTQQTIYILLIIFIVFVMRGKVLDFLLLWLFAANAIWAIVDNSLYTGFVFVYMLICFIYRQDLKTNKPVSTFRMVDKYTAI